MLPSCVTEQTVIWCMDISYPQGTAPGGNAMFTSHIIDTQLHNSEKA